MSKKTDDILKKYGISKTTTTSNSSTKNAEEKHGGYSKGASVSSILNKYGLSDTALGKRKARETERADELDKSNVESTSRRLGLMSNKTSDNTTTKKSTSSKSEKYITEAADEKDKSNESSISRMDKEIRELEGKKTAARHEVWGASFTDDDQKRLDELKKTIAIRTGTATAAQLRTAEEQAEYEKQIAEMSVGARLAEWGKNLVSGATKQYAAGTLDTNATLYEAGKNFRSAYNNTAIDDAKRNYETAVRDLEIMKSHKDEYTNKEISDQERMVETTKAQYEAFSHGLSDETQDKAIAAARDFDARLTQSGARDVERAVDVSYLGEFGKVATEGAASAIQSAIDGALSAGLATPGIAADGARTMIPFAVRCFGNSAMVARNAGKDITTQIGYGIAASAIEIATEKMGNVGLQKMAYGKGFSGYEDRMASNINKAVQSLADKGMSVRGQEAVKLGLVALKGMFTEGLEEFVGDALDIPLTLASGVGKLPYSTEEWMNEATRDFVVGALSALVGYPAAGAKRLISNKQYASIGKDLRAKGFSVRSEIEKASVIDNDFAKEIHETAWRQYKSSGNVSDVVLGQLYSANQQELARLYTQAQLLDRGMTLLETENGQATATSFVNEVTTQAAITSNSDIQEVLTKAKEEMRSGGQVSTATQAQMRSTMANHAEQLTALGLENMAAYYDTNSAIEQRKTDAVNALAGTQTLDSIATAYLNTTGKNLPKDVAQSKAEVVQKLLNGEAVTQIEVNKLLLNSPAFVQTFNDVTGTNLTAKNNYTVKEVTDAVNEILQQKEAMTTALQDIIDTQRFAGLMSGPVQLTLEGKRKTNEQEPTIRVNGEDMTLDQFRNFVKENIPDADKITEEEIEDEFNKELKAQRGENDGDLHDDGEGRIPSSGSGEQADGVAERAEERYRTEKVTTSTGYANLLTEEEAKRFVEENPEAKTLVERVTEHGGTVRFMAGDLIVGDNSADGKTNTVAREVWVRIDGQKTLMQIGNHEDYHLRISTDSAFRDFARAWGVMNVPVDVFREKYDTETGPYTPILGECPTTVFSSASAEEKNKINDYIEEVCADLAGNFNRVGMEESQWSALIEKFNAAMDYFDGLNTEAETEDMQTFEDGSTKLSLSTYDESGREKYINYLAKAVSEEQLSQTDANAMIQQLDAIYKICKDAKDTNKYKSFSEWSEARVVTDEKGNPVFSVVKANGEYVMNLDFSLVCKKRRTLDAVLNILVKNGFINNMTIGEEEISRINDLIRSYGFETACALCFVDSKRYKQGKVADTFVNLYNTEVKLIKRNDGKEIKHQHFNFGGNVNITDNADTLDTIPTKDLDFSALDAYIKENGFGSGSVEVATAKLLKKSAKDRKLLMRGDFMSTRGLDAVKVQNAEVLKLFNRKKGTGGPKSAQSDVQYLNEIISSTKFKRDKAYLIGGVRIQSFSDYVPRLVFDYVQMISELAAKKLPAHAYTKEELFVLQFGLTGIKINMSLVPDVVEDGVAPGLDANGNYVWHDGQSFASSVNEDGSAQKGYELAKKIQHAEGYSKNCGIIAVGISDEHIRKMLADPEIRMVIPYHKSSLSHIVAVMNNVDAFTNYESSQNTRTADGKKLDKKIPAQKKILDEEPGFNELLQQGKTPREAAEAYVRWCEDNNLLPKFDQFCYKTFDGVEAIDENGRRIVDENYYKLLEDFTVYDKGQYVPQSDVTMSFPTEDSAFGSMNDLILRGLEEDALLEAKRDADVPSIVNAIMNPEEKLSVNDAEYLELAKEPEANREKLQKMVEDAARKAGYTIKAYHGTANGGHFTKFDASKLNNSTLLSHMGQGFYFTNSKEGASEYTSNFDIYGNQSKGKNPHLFSGYLKLDNPIIITSSSHNLRYETIRDIVATGEYDWFINSGIAHQLQGKEVAGRTYSKSEINSLSTPDKISLFSTYLSQNGDMFALREMTRAFKYDEQGKLLKAMKAFTGNDGFVWEMRDGLSQYVAFDSEQFKESDPVTYDDDGDIIPLSERFNEKNEDIRYSLAPDLKKNLESVKNRTFPGEYTEVEIGSTSDFLVNELQAPQLVVLMPSQKAYRAISTEEEAIAQGQPRESEEIHYHGLGVDGLYEALEASEHPVIAFAADEADNGKFANRIVLVTSMKKDDKNIIVLSDLDDKGRFNGKQVAANKDVTVYEKTDLNTMLKSAVDSNRILFVDKKEVRKLLGDQHLQSLTTMQTSDFKDNIARFWAGVKWRKSGKSQMSFGADNQTTAMAEAMKKALEKKSSESNTTNAKYSLAKTEPVKPSSNTWTPGPNTDTVREQYPMLWAVDANTSEERNPTQISGTKTTYDKVYQMLKDNGFSGKILDASSGLGLGTELGRSKYGFDVEDIEPYPGANYTPMYTDYSTLDENYDFIISNAVLNVLPQDQRDDLVHKMASMLNDGGQMFINVRGKDVENASSKAPVTGDKMGYVITNTGSYQKGFTKPELIAYLKDALGDGYTVKSANIANTPNVIVTKEVGKSDLTGNTEVDKWVSNTKYSVQARTATFFSGAGTVDYALRNLIDSQIAVEYDAKIAAVYKMNNGEDIFIGDVRDVDVTQFHKGQIEYFHASPVCKNYSMAKIADEADNQIDITTAEATANALKQFKPKVFTVENVARYRDSKAMKSITDALDELGYSYDKNVYRATDFGGATIRERMFLRAVAPGGVLPEIQKTEGTNWYDAVYDLIPGLKEEAMPDWMAARLPAMGIKSIKDITEPLLIIGGNKGGKLSMAWYNQPSPTILANTHDARIVMPGGKVLRVSPRVLARIQGLPDSFKLPDKTTLAFKVIGNGVPVQLTQGIVSPLLEANIEDKDIKFSISPDARKALDSALGKYGAQEQSSRDARDVKFPKQMTDTTKTMRTERTVANAAATPIGRIDTIQQAVVDQKFEYTTVTNRESYQRAEAELKTLGWRQTVENWTKAVHGGKASVSLVATGAALLNHAGNSNASGEEYLDILIDYSTLLHNASQATQAAQILQKLTPDGRLYSVMKTVNRLNNSMREKAESEIKKAKSKGNYDPSKVSYREIKISDDLIERFRAAQTDEARDAIIDEMAQYVADQVKANKSDLVNAIRYLNMLGNFKTQIRNVMGNVAFQPVRLMKDAAQGAIEAMMGVERTTGVKRDAATYKAAFEIYHQYRLAVMSGGKYNDNAGVSFDSLVADKRAIFTKTKNEFFNNTAGKVFERYRNLTNTAMEKGDDVFCAFTFADSLARFMASRNTTWENASEELRTIAVNMAIKEAAEATYRDNNALSNWIASLARDQKTPEFIRVVAEGILPFRKTPTNILVRAYEYSPISVIENTIRTIRYNTGKNELSGTDIADMWAKSFSGTVLVAIGFALSAMGKLIGKAPDDDKEKALFDQKGLQAYSLVAFGRTFTLDWAAPSCIPLFIGANLFQSAMEDGLTMEEFMEAFTTRLADPIMEMSILQGVNDAIENVATYGSDQALVSFIMNAAWSYITQLASNTLLGQVERAYQNIRMQTYVDKNGWLPVTVQRGVGKTSAKIPGWDYHQIPYINAWGEVEGNARNEFANIMQQLFAPWYVSQVDTSNMMTEIDRLYSATNDSGVILETADKYFTVAGQRKDLTAAEYMTYAMARGQVAKSAVNDLLKSASYKSLSDAEKVAAIKRVYDYANQKAKASVTNQYTPDKWVTEGMQTLSNAGVSAATYATLYSATKDMESYKDSNGESVDNSKSLKIMQQIYSTPGLSDEQVQALAEELGVNKTVRKYSSKIVDRKLEAMEKKYGK